MTKIFIVSLPRTGTTSICLYLLDCGFKVAHTAYSDYVLEEADVIADTPVFVDYPTLYRRYPDAKFVYLERQMSGWIPSIRRLLQTMRKQWLRDCTFFEKDIKRCFQYVFPGFEAKKDFKNTYLLAAYERHKSEVLDFFIDKPEQFLRLDLEKIGAGKMLCQFCGVEVNEGFYDELPHVNKGRRIAYWASIEHTNKVNSK